MWWKKPLAIVQTNLQIRDALKIDPKRLIQQVKDMHADALLFNVGGIYAWYPTEVAYHHKGAFLDVYPTLLDDVIAECHRAGMKFIARFDFGTAVDVIYNDHPEWFVQLQNRKPHIIGEHRPGGWELLYETCIRSAYRHEAVGLPVLRESLSRYNIDGVFINGPHPRDCWCDACRQAYLESFGTPMPEDAKNFDPRWNTIQYKYSVDQMHEVVHEFKVPFLLYYMYQHITGDCFNAEVICEEARDSLSEGISAVWQPSVRMKICNRFSTQAPPWGFIHSAPGLDWRHVGLPPAEYKFWLSQIPANGATLIHSITGVPDTIMDKRILSSVTWANEHSKQIYPLLEGKKPIADVAVLINEASLNPEESNSFPWANALTNMQMPYELLIDQDIAYNRLKPYKLIIAPNGYHFTSDALKEIEAYVRDGGSFLHEGALPREYEQLYRLCGIKPFGKRSAALDGAYFRNEPEGDFLSKNGLEQTVFLALRGEVFYCRPDSARVLATLVPPYVPACEAHTPPERASMLTPHTDMPIIMENHFGKGMVSTLILDLAKLYETYVLPDHLIVLKNLVHHLVGTPTLQLPMLHGLYATLFGDDHAFLLQLTNGTGQRPLANTTPLYNLDVCLQTKGDVKRIIDVFNGQEVPFHCDARGCCFLVKQLDIWNGYHIELSNI